MNIPREVQKELRIRLEQNGFPADSFGRKQTKRMKKRMLLIALSRRSSQFAWAYDFTNEECEQAIELVITRDKR